MNGILLFFHCSQETGYAISTLKRRFRTMAENLVDDEGDIHFSYTAVADDPSQSSSPDSQTNVLEFDPTSGSPEALDRLSAYIRDHGIDFAFGFDAPVRMKSYRAMRRAGVENIVSYWGAPISSINSGLKLLVKKLEVRLYPWGPEHFVFESEAMAETATRGRGIPERDVSVVYLGVDPEKFSPDVRDPGYLNREFDIPEDREVVIFSGHMTERKGIDVLMRAARMLREEGGRRDFHVLLLGNRDGEERPYLDLVDDGPAGDHVTFGGYRDDIPTILPHCSIGVIPSTGWDSFTVSAAEMAASGLPLVVSDLQGLAETVDHETTGYTFAPGDHRALADRLEFLLGRPEKQVEMGKAARDRVLDRFTESRQIDDLVEICQMVAEP